MSYVQKFFLVLYINLNVSCPTIFANFQKSIFGSMNDIPQYSTYGMQYKIVLVEYCSIRVITISYSSDIVREDDVELIASIPILFMVAVTLSKEDTQCREIGFRCVFGTFK